MPRRSLYHRPSRMTVERTQTEIRMDRTLLKVLKGLAEYLDMSLADLLEGLLLHALDGKAAITDEDTLPATTSTPTPRRHREANDPPWTAGGSCLAGRGRGLPAGREGGREAEHELLPAAGGLHPGVL